MKCQQCQLNEVAIKRPGFNGNKTLFFCSYECNVKNLEGMLPPQNPKKREAYLTNLAAARLQFDEAKAAMKK